MNEEEDEGFKFLHGGVHAGLAPNIHNPKVARSLREIRVQGGNLGGGLGNVGDPDS